MGKCAYLFCFLGIFVFFLSPVTAQALDAEATLLKILAADETPEDPNLFEPDGDGIVDRAHFRLLDRVLEDESAPRHAEIAAIWGANRAQVAEDNRLTFECTLLERLLGLTCDDFEVYGASQITIGDPAGNARIQRLLDTVGIDISLDNYDFSAASWLAAGGDLDGDGFTNLEEYDAVCADFDAFVEAAIDPLTTPESLFCCGDCPLEFSELPQGADLYVGEALSLSVAVENAEAEPQYLWLKDGEETAITAQTLSVALAALGDAGDYQCRVTDGGETITTPVAAVRVAERMNFTEQPADALLYRNETLSLRVAVSGGLEPLTYAWRRGGTLLGSEAEYRLANAPLGANGSYQCTVSDARESVLSVVAEVQIGERMGAVAQPVSQTVLRGGSATFGFSVLGGIGELRYQWYRGDTPVGGNAATLTLDTVGLADAGDYRCVVNDAREELRSSVAVLAVVEPLAITLQPVGARKLAGSSHTFTVEASGGIPPLSYRWFKGEQALNATTSTLTLSSLAPANAGEYWCEARDATGPVASARALLEVFNPLQITAQPMGASKLVGSPHSMVVAIADGGGSETYRWFKDNAPTGDTTPTLAFAALTVADSGAYFCEVTDEFSTVRSAVAVINVAESVLITLQPEGAAKYTGGAHTFSVVAEGGLGPLAYRWLKDGTPTGITAPTFTLAPLRVDDAGDYQCEVSDGTETARSSVARLEVAERLAFTTQPVGARLLVGESLSLSAQTTGGLGTVRYRWLLGGEVVGVGADLTVGEVALADAGTYFCEASDQFETVLAEPATVVVAEALRFVQEPQSAVREVGDSITFSATIAGGLGNVSFAWERNGEPVGGASPTLTLNNLATTDAGAYACRATDERGPVSSANAQLTVITPLRFTEPLEGLEALAGDGAELRVFAAGGDAPLQYAWYRNDEALDATGPILRFAPLRETDAGTYHVRVSDGFQEITSGTVTVVVLPRLAVTLDPSGASVTVGERVSLEAAAMGGRGAYHYAWFLDGEPLAAFGARLDLGRVYFDDAGDYTCAISDDVDTVTTAAATLIVLPKPVGVLDTNPSNGGTIDLGEVSLAVPAQRTVTLRNTGAAPLAYSLSVEGDPQFSAVALTPVPVLAPGAETTATVTFQPIVPGDFSAELILVGDGEVASAILLRGTGVSKGFWACGASPGRGGALGAGDAVAAVLALAALCAARRSVAIRRGAW